MTWRSEESRGFTLIELVVVLAVLGCMAAVIAGGATPHRGVELRAAADEIAEALRLARSRAIFEDRTATLSVDLVHRRYRLDQTPERVLPADLALELRTVAGEVATASTGRIRFLPDGSSTGGRITLARGGTVLAIGVDWISGRVAIAEIR